MSAKFLHAAPDGIRVAKVDKRALHESLVHGIADAIHRGVATEQLDGLRAYRDVDELRIVNAHEARLNALRGGIKDSTRRAEVQLRAMEDCETAEEQAAVQALARKHIQEAARVKKELASLERHLDQRELGDEFVGEVDYLLTGLQALATEDCLVDADIAHAMRTVLRDFALEVRGSEAHWSICLLVPVAGRVARVGPITGSIPLRGLPTTNAHLANAPVAGTSKKARVQAKQTLEAAGYSSIAATVAALAPQPEFVAALLDESPAWTSSSTNFNSSAFDRHLQVTYRKLSVWSLNKYCINSATRQNVVSFVADHGGEVTLEKLAAALPDLGLTRGHLNSMLDGRTTPSGNTIAPVIERRGQWGTHRSYSNTAIVANIDCPSCSEPATGASLIPELPGGLICRSCLVPPALPGLVFPDIYRLFALPHP